MKAWILLCIICLTSGCETTAPVNVSKSFHDDLFNPPEKSIHVEEILDVSNEMQDFLSNQVRYYIRRGNDPKRALFNAITKSGKISIEYDAEMTKNAAETFKTQTGNCLSLVLMTAALAKKLDMYVEYQNVELDEEAWKRMGEIYFSAGHVNIVLGKKAAFDRSRIDQTDTLIIDFIPPDQALRQRSSQISEKRVIAMYLNNRAAELLSKDRIDDAYWYARAAILQDPDFLTSFNTLGVIYRRHGDLSLAKHIFTQIADQHPKNIIALSNLHETLMKLGDTSTADEIGLKLKNLQSYEPFYFLNQAKLAIRNNDLVNAKNLLHEEIAHNPSNDESHFWLAVVHYRLGEFQETAEQLILAKNNSITRKTYDLYSAKLNYLNSRFLTK